MILPRPDKEQEEVFQSPRPPGLGLSWRMTVKESLNILLIEHNIPVQHFLKFWRFSLTFKACLPSHSKRIMQDHTQNSKFLHQHQIVLLPWSACFPNLSLIEQSFDE
ncbi:hypothetical protein TNCV_946011 [Trichonephila clavipes]|nr:hypothetical protein TNCV_946011 [Trichonephila clavipes]